MTPYRKKGGRTYYLTLPLKDGGYLRPTSGTRDRETAVAMQAMLTELGRRGARGWDIIDAIAARRFSVPQVYDYYVGGRLEDLRALLRDTDLAPAIDAWEARIWRERATETARKYTQGVQLIFPRALVDGKPTGPRLPAWRSTVTRAWLKSKLAAVPGSNTNRRRRAAAWLSVLSDLVEAELLEQNPMLDLTIPASNPPKSPHLLITEAQRLVGLMPEGPHRALSAFRHGAGIEFQATIGVRRRDIVDEVSRVIWAHGTKNTHRDRQVIVEPWAWTIVRNYVKSAGLLPDALLFPVDKREHARLEREALTELVRLGATGPLSGATGKPLAVEQYRLHGACHTYCIDGMKQGKDPVLLANNRGHANTQMVLTLYGKFRPTVVDLVRADRRAQGEKR